MKYHDDSIQSFVSTCFSLMATVKDGTNPSSSSNINNNNINKNQLKKKQVYKHLFRHYDDISFDSWLRCAEPEEFLRSVGYTPQELERLEQDNPQVLQLNVHDQLAPKIRFLVETLKGGTGRLTWSTTTSTSTSTSSNRPIINGDDNLEECVVSDEESSLESSMFHSMRLYNTTKQVVPASYFSCSLDRIVGPHHAYLARNDLPHGPDLLENPELLTLFLDSCTKSSSSMDDFVELCQEWERDPHKKALHTKQSIQAFEQDFTPGLLPAAKCQISTLDDDDDNDNDSNDSNNTTNNHYSKFEHCMIPLMVQHGYNPLEYDNQGILPIHWAAGAGNLRGVQVLVQDALLEHDEYKDIVDVMDKACREPKQGATPFHWACCGMSTEFVGEGGSLEICRWMLEEASKHNTNTENRSRELANLETWTKQDTPILWAAWGGSLPIVQLLVQHGANPFAMNRRDETALHWAAAAGHLDICQYLLKEQCSQQEIMITMPSTTSNDHDEYQNPNDKNTKNSTTIHQLKLLTQPDQTGRSPLDYAKLYDRMDIVNWMTSIILSSIPNESMTWA